MWKKYRGCSLFCISIEFRRVAIHRPWEVCITPVYCWFFGNSKLIFLRLREKADIISYPWRRTHSLGNAELNNIKTLRVYIYIFIGISA